MVAKQERQERPKRVKLTLSMTEDDRRYLEERAFAEGTTMAGLVHMWIQRDRREGGLDA